VCPAFDQRFFLNPTATGGHRCDIGSTTTSSPAATQETSAGAPTCGTPTVVNNGGVLSQTVPVGFSVLGFEGSGTGDIVNSGDAINGIINNNNSLGHGNAPGGITNGTASLLNPFTGTVPNSGTLNVQATKTTAGQATFWSFTATDWAGLSTYCS
jgi:hypothetical protein